MKKITIECSLGKQGITVVQKINGFDMSDIESHLLIIGILDDLKQQHLSKLKTNFEAIQKDGDYNKMRDM